MAPSTAATLVGAWLLAIGLLCVYFEVRNVHCGVRIRELLEEESHWIETVRQQQTEYYRLLSGDLLEASIEDDGLVEEFYGQPAADEEDQKSSSQPESEESADAAPEV